MQLAAAYIAVILIWSTTPLGIVWSADSVSPSLALLMRMSIALVLGSVIILLARIEFPWGPRALRFYCNSTIGVAGGMFFTYMASRSIPSGMISLVFGFAPILSGVFAQKILGEAKFSLSKKCALVLAFSGLFIVCYGKLFISQGAQPVNYIDMLFILIAVVFFSLSGVMVKSVQISMHPLASTVGTLIISLPIFVLAWWITDGAWVKPEFQLRSLLSIIYLGVIGSLFGFVAYFYVLKRMSATTVSLVTLITPVLAIFLGNQLNGEVVTESLVIGTLCILGGLFLYFFGHRLSR